MGITLKFLYFDFSSCLKLNKTFNTQTQSYWHSVYSKIIKTIKSEQKKPPETCMPVRVFNQSSMWASKEFLPIVIYTCIGVQGHEKYLK